MLIHVLLSTIKEGHGFSLQQSSILRQPTVLSAKNEPWRRRDLLNAIKRVFIGTGGAVMSRGIPAAFAEDTAPVGKVVEIAVANLDGEAGKTGTIRIQLKPEWAPRGVARFEVSLVLIFCVRYLATYLLRNNHLCVSLIGRLHVYIGIGGKRLL
jgi:hypothetical protein